MRRTVFGLAAAGLLVIAACGGDDDDSAGGDEGTEEAPSGGGSQSQFCEDFTEFTTQGPEAATDPSAIIDAMRELEPPEEIAEAFSTTLEGAEIQAQLAEGGEEPDPEMLEEFQSRSQEYADASSQVQEYVSTECDLSEVTGSTDTTAAG
jgi:hypothetical protein